MAHIRAQGRWRWREQGSVAVMFFFLIPLFLLVASLVIEVGRYELKVKDLESATDAAGLAGMNKVAEIVLEADTDVITNRATISSQIATEIVSSFEKHGYDIPYDYTGFYFDGQTIHLSVQGTSEMQFHSYIPGLDQIYGTGNLSAASQATMDYDNGNLVCYTASPDQLIYDRVPWAVHHVELHDTTYITAGDKYELVELGGDGKFVVGQEYILKLGSFKDELVDDTDQWHVTDEDHDGYYDDDLDRDGFHDDDNNLEDDNGDYFVVGAGTGGTAWEVPHVYTMTNGYYIPMDGGQAQALKAYYVVWQALNSGDCYWCLGLDGGSFVIPQTAANLTALTAAGVSYSPLGAGAGRTTALQADGTYVSALNAGSSSLTYTQTIMLDRQPDILCVSDDPGADPIVALLTAAGFPTTDIDYFEADRSNNNVRISGVVGDAIFEAVISDYEWSSSYNLDYTDDEDYETMAEYTSDWLELGGTLWAQNLSAKTLDQALEGRGIGTLAYTNPRSGFTLADAGYVASLDNLLGDTYSFLRNSGGSADYTNPLVQSDYGYGMTAAGAADATDHVAAISGTFSSINPEFIDFSKNVTVGVWYDPLTAGAVVWNESGWKASTTNMSELSLDVDLNGDGDKSDNHQISAVYDNRVAWGWDGFATSNVVQHWVDEHTETVYDWSTIIGHICTKSGCANPSCCNTSPSHVSKWIADVPLSYTVTVAGQWVVDYTEYNVDLNKDGDYTDAISSTTGGLTAANAFVKELSGTYGKGSFAFSAGAGPVDTAGKRLILNSLLTAGARDGVAFFGACDLDGSDGEAGATFYRNNAWFGFYDSVNVYHRFLDSGDLLYAEAGNMYGPTNKGVLYRYFADPENTVDLWDRTSNSGRVVLVPIVEMEGDTWSCMYELPKDASDADRTMRVTGTAFFFLEDLVHETPMRTDLGLVKPGQVRGIFLGYQIEP